MEYVLLLIGFVVLIKGADIFVDGCSSAAKKLGIPSMIIGLTIVAMGTSAPEASVSVAASVKQSAGIAVGNIVGSNLFNLLFIIGLCLLFVKMSVSDDTLKRDCPYLLVSTFVLIIACIDGALNRIEASVLLILMVLYIILLIRNAKKNIIHGESEQENISVLKTIIFIILGLASVMIGGDVVVESAKDIALDFGLSEQFIGLSIVAIGTSLPELVTSLAAVRKNEMDLAIGNVIGSNIFNTLFVLGLAGVVRPVLVSPEAFTDMIICAVLSIIVYLMCIHKKKLGLVKGIMMICMYCAFFAYVLLR